MRRRPGWMALLLLLLLTAWPTLVRSEEPLTPEQIVSSIDPNLWYPGSQVRDALLQVMVIGRAEIKSTSEAAVKTAVTPLKAEVAQRTVERDEYKGKYETAAGQVQGAQQTAVWTGIGGTVLGVLLTVLFAVLVK
jgi:hypothetical protein